MAGGLLFAKATVVFRDGFFVSVRDRTDAIAIQQ
jgi:hypothetical protein